MIDQMQLMKVEYALEKICKAYASERISQSLFRHQRAALIEVLQYPELPFPELVLNEYAQGFDESFYPEETPLVADMHEQEMHYEEDYYPEDHYQEAPRSHFDRFYFWYLSSFLIVIGAYVYFNP